MDNLVDLSSYRQAKLDTVKSFKTKVEAMNADQICEEVVAFNQLVKKSDKLSKESIQKGMIIFTALEKCTNDKRLLEFVSMYLNHLSQEFLVLKNASG